METNDNGREKLTKELDEFNNKFLSLTEGVLEQRYHILSTAEQNLFQLHIEQLKNIGIISGVVAPFSLTLLQLDSLEINVSLLLLGFIILIANIVLSLFILHKILIRKNELVTEASVNLNFASVVRNDLKSGTDSTSKIGADSMSLIMDNVRKTDKALGISTNNTESLTTKIKLRKYDEWLVYLFGIGCASIILAVVFTPLTKFLSGVLDKLIQLAF